MRFNTDLAPFYKIFRSTVLFINNKNTFADLETKPLLKVHFLLKILNFTYNESKIAIRIVFEQNCFYLQYTGPKLHLGDRFV